MAYYKCKDCKGSFSAVSLEEVAVAKKEIKSYGESKGEKPRKQEDESDYSYARFCPYCGSLDIKVA